MVILGSISGFNSLQGLSRFFKHNESYFINLFGLKHGVPGYTRTRTLLKEIGFEPLTQAFYKWAKQFIEQQDECWLKIDGKGLNSTYTSKTGKDQNFHALVSVFVKDKGIVVNTTRYENKKESEIVAVRSLIEQLEEQGLVLTLDALHCQKKRSKPSWSQEMTM
jgi:hypothetical protein